MERTSWRIIRYGCIGYVIYSLFGAMLADCSTFSYTGLIGRQDPPQYFWCPVGVCIRADGSVVVADLGLPGLYAFSASGALQWRLNLGEDPYRLPKPSAVIARPGGDLILLDSRKLVLADVDGAGRLLWSSTWPDSGSFDRPCGLVADSNGYIYMTEAKGASINRSSPAGIWLSKFGVKGTDPGQFGVPCRIATDTAGNLVISDNHLNRVQKFDASGNYLNWSCGSDCPQADLYPPEGQFLNVVGVAVDSSGQVYACDAGVGLISKFASDGTYISRFGGYGTGDNQFMYANDAALQGSGALWVVDSPARVVRKMDTVSGQCLATLGSPGNLDGQLVLPERLCIDSSGNTYVVDRGTNRIAKFSSTDAFVAFLGSPGSGDGQFVCPRGIALDNTGSFLYVTDCLNYRVQKLTLSGAYASQFGGRGDSDGQFQSPAGITIDTSGDVYVVDSVRGNVQRFNSAGVFQSELGGGTLNSPESCAVDSAGNVYVVDSGRNQVRKYNSSGSLLLSFGGNSSTADGSFQYPIDVKLGQDGDLYVIEHFGDCRVQKFDTSGQFLGKIQGVSCGTDDLFRASGLAFDNGGNLCVSDAGSHRIARFAVSNGPAMDLIKVDDVTTSGATIKWATDVASTSAVDCWASGGIPTHVEDSTAVNCHIVSLTGLQANTRYCFTVTSSAGGNSSLSGAVAFWTLPTSSAVEAENSVDVGYRGTWSKTVDASASASVYAESDDTTSPAKLYLNYTGTGVAIKYIGLPSGGKAKYYLDGSVNPTGEIDFYAATVTYDQSLSVSGQTFGKHKLAIKWFGSSTGEGNTLAVDRFVITRM